MTPADADRTPLDDRLLRELLAEDAALAAGGEASIDDAPTGDADATYAGAPPDLRACLRLLEQVWPRGADDLPGEPVTASPWRLGRFEVLEELGRGGFGVVYLAHDPTLGRRVALKVPGPDALLSPDHRRRFLNEARAAGSLDHPGIVPVHDAGEDGLLCYIASTYCEGPTLAAWLRRRSQPVPVRVAARLVARMADAVQHAHDRNVLHCDIKPSNVLLQAGPDPLDPLDFQPRLTDFGLARLADAGERGDPSRSGVPVGSPPYMAPEQAAGRSREVGRATDVYALGASLYEALTGRPPFRGETMAATLRLVLDTDPVPPRALRPGLPRDLETVCLTCLAKEPAQRYPTAAALRDDLQRFLAGEPIRARPPSAWERARRQARRHPWAAAGLAAATLAVAAGLALGAASNAWLRAHNEELRVAIRRADRAVRLAARHAEGARLRLARQALELGQCERAQEILADAPPPDGGDPPGFVRRYLERLARREVVPFAGRDLLFDRLSLAPGGRTLVGYNAAGRVLVWDVLADRPVAAFTAPGRIEPLLRFSPDGRLAAGVESWGDTPGHAGRGWVWDIETGRLVAELPAVTHLTPLADGRLLVERDSPVRRGVEVRIACLGAPSGGAGPAAVEPVASLTLDAETVVVSPDGTRLAMVRANRTKVFDARTGAPVSALEGFLPPVPRSYDFSGDGRTLVEVGSAPPRITFWDADSGKARAAYDVSTPPYAVAVGHDGATAALLSHPGEVTLWHRDRGRVAVVRPDDLDRVREVMMALSPDGGTLALSSHGRPGGNGPVTLWDTATGRKRAEYPGRPVHVAFLGFADGGRSLVVFGEERFRLWKPDPGPAASLTLHLKDEAWALAYAPDGHTFALGADDSDEPATLQVRDADTGALRAGWKPHDATVAAVAYSPDGRRLVTAALVHEHNMAVWDVATRTRVCELEGVGAAARAAAFSPDGRLVAGAGNDGAVRLWEADTGKAVAVLRGHTDTVRRLAFGRDGQVLASASNDGNVRLWDVVTGEPVRALTVGSHCAAVAWLPDGRTIAAGGEDGRISLWDSETGDRRTVIHSDDSELRCLAVSPDGRALASAGASKLVRVWDPDTGQELLSLDGHAATVTSLAFSPDGLGLASTALDGAVLVWRAVDRPVAPAR